MDKNSPADWRSPATAELPVLNGAYVIGRRPMAADQLSAVSAIDSTPPGVIAELLRPRENALEGELFDRTGGVDSRLPAVSVTVLGTTAHWHSRVFIALGLKQLFGDAHLPVVLLA